MERGIIDELRLFVAPVILGGGKRLFRSMKERCPLKRVDVKKFESGTVLLSYVPA